MMRHGDEFNLLLVNKGAERSFLEMEEILKYLSDNMFKLSDGTKEGSLHVTISCGNASYPRGSKNSVELLRVADSSTFRAKNLGKTEYACLKLKAWC